MVNETNFNLKPIETINCELNGLLFEFMKGKLVKQIYLNCGIDFS